MRRARLLVLAAMALLAFGALGTATAGAEEKEEKSNPRILCLETGCIKGLAATLKGGESRLENLKGETITSKKVEAKLEGCEPIAGTGEKDTNLCKNIKIDFFEWKKAAVSCRSENAKGEKDPVETVLELLDLHIAAEETSGKVLQPLLLAKVLGPDEESELTIVCGVVKAKIKGVLPCLLLPGLTNIPTTTEVEVTCKVNSTTHDPDTGTCTVLCELLKEPFESSFGNGFSDGGMNMTLKGKFNKDIYLDD